MTKNLQITVRDTAEFLALKKKAQGLSLANRLHLAAELVSAGKFVIAETIAGEVVSELSAKRISENKRVSANTEESGQ
jgi:hypothetical protein